MRDERLICGSMREQGRDRHELVLFGLLLDVADLLGKLLEIVLVGRVLLLELWL